MLNIMSITSYCYVVIYYVSLMSQTHFFILCESSPTPTQMGMAFEITIMSQFIDNNNLLL